MLIAALKQLIVVKRYEKEVKRYEKRYGHFPPCPR